MNVEPILTITIAVFFIIGIIVLGVVLHARRKKREAERTAAMRSTATMLGWEFGEQAPWDWIPNLDKFSLFSEGHSKGIYNIMYGEMNGVKSAFFDYFYVTGHGKHRTEHWLSVFYAEPRNLNLPFFSLRPENVLHKFISMFGYQDIDFHNRPSFSNEYILRGTDEQAVRNTFNDGLLSFYETNHGVSTDGGGNQVFIFRNGHRSPPEEVQSFITWGSYTQNLFPRWG
ncbi:MAG TPA: hypothetical protein VGW36_00225 [Pyrinomonadaceae bacterium]|nr:hypothetical protein [Pyrinomonadaceae bacterium]